MTAPNGEKWAVITGASSGIGRALAFEFAQGGYCVVLSGRNEAALKQAAIECAQRFHVQSQVIAADLSRLEDIDRLIATLAAAPRCYEALVNNAGFGIHGDFVSTDVDQEIAMVHVQLAAALKLTKALLPSMQARRRGNILNIASVYAFGPVPEQSVYAACKAFLLSFSAALQNEVRDSGIRVTVFCPGITQTSFRARAGISENSKASGMTAEAVARIGYAAMQRGQHIVVPGLANRVFMLLSRLLPTTSFTSVVGFINRKRGLNQPR